MILSCLQWDIFSKWRKKMTFKNPKIIAYREAYLFAYVYFFLYIYLFLQLLLLLNLKASGYEYINIYHETTLW